MRLTRVFVDAPLASGERVALPAEAAAHLTRVLRLGPGDACILFNGRGGEFAARLGTIGKRETVVEIGAFDAVERESPLRIVLLQGLARGERMDFIVQKATELGVAAIRPLHTARSGVKLDAVQSARKLAHWRSVAISACEQCLRNRVPDVLEPLPLEAALAAAPEGARLLLSCADTGPMPISAELPRGAPITLLVGPEGGFADDEEALATRSGFAPLRLGPRVLRTETAGLAAIAAVQTLAGDWLVR